MPDNIYPDLSNDRFDIQYARLLGLSSDLQASAIISGSDSPPPPIETPDDDTTGLMRFGAPAEDDEAGENRSFDLGAGFSFALTQLGNNHFLVDPPNGLYQLGAVPVPGSDSGLSYTYLEIDDVDKKITLQAPEGIVLPGYGYGNHAGAATYNLAVDAGGNLIEVSATGGGYTNLTQFVDQNNWKVFYSDGSGDVQELSIGASGDVLTSNGTSAAPSWQTPSAGSGTVNSGLQYKAAYYITNPSGTVIDDWAGCNFGQTNLNTQIVCQSATEVGLEIKAAGSQSANLLNISSSSSTGDYITVDGSGNSTFKQRARFQGAVVETAVGVDRVDIGVTSGTPRMVFEDAGNTIWEIDNFAGTFRMFNPSAVRFYLTSIDAGVLLPFAVGPTAVASRMFNVTEDNATNAGVTYLGRFMHTTSGTPGIGIGVGFEFYVETVAGGATGSVNKLGGIMEVVANNVSDNTEAFDFVFKTMDDGNAATESLRILSDGRLKVTLLNQDDSEDKIVVWNDTDKIFEWRDAATLGGGGGYTNLTQFVAQNNWKVFYSDGSGDVQELSIGASGDVLTSNGTAAAPSWETPSGGSITADNGLTMSTATNVQLGGTLLANSTVSGGASFVMAFASSGGQRTLEVYSTGGGLGLRVYTQNATTNTVLEAMHIGRASSGTAANGIGVAAVFTPQTSDGSLTEANKLISKWTNATLASRTSQLIFTGVLSTSTVDLLVLAGDGSVKLRPITSTAASAITPAEGMMLFVSDTDATFTAIGFWGYENGAWAKL